MYILRADDLSIIGSRRYPSHIREGWGLTHDGSQLIFSDGTSQLHFLEFPTNYSDSAESQSQLKHEYLVKSRHVVVRTMHDNREIHQINELEFAHGYVYANIWYQDTVIKIDPRTGYVVNSYDMSHVYPRATRSRTSDCLNGIAYEPSENKFMVTGKKWPVAFLGVFSNLTDLELNSSSSHDL